MSVVFWELAETLRTLGKKGPLYNLLSPYKGAHKICSIYWVYDLYKCFIKPYQKSEVSLMMAYSEDATLGDGFDVRFTKHKKPQKKI